MAKRRQTTGLPKKSRKDKDEQIQDSSFFNRLLGNPSNRAEYDEALNTFIQRVAFGLLGSIAAIIVIALVYQYLFVPYVRTVATVNGESITVHQFRERIAFEQGLVLQQAQSRAAQVQQFVGQESAQQFLDQDQQYQQWVRELQLVDLLGQRVLDDMIDELLIKQEAEERGITINDDAIENQVQNYFGYDPTQVALIGTPATETPIPDPTNTPFVSPTPTSTPLPTATPTEIPAEATVEATAEATDEVMATATIPPSPTPSQEERLEDFEESVDLFRENLRSTSDTNNAQIDAFFERQALSNALMEEVIPAQDTALYVNARHILVDTEEEANEIIAALEDGESFASLAQARSTDTGSGSRGGELSWASVSNYVPEFKEAVSTGEVGAILGPVESQFGFHIIQVRAREDREVEDAEREQLRQVEFAQWVENLREENEANITTNDNWPNFLPTS